MAVSGLLLAAAGCAARAPREAGANTPVMAAAEGLDAAARDWVDRTLAGLDLRRRVAQLVVPRVSGSYMAVGTREYERVRLWVEDLGVGGLIETLGPPLEAAVKLNLLQDLAAVPLLITADMEHGPGQLLNGGVVLPYGLENGGGVRFPPAMGLGAAGDDRLAYELGRITAIEGRAIGVHLNFAPVLDVNNNPANPIINTRSFGADPSLVSRMAASMIRGMQEHRMLATAKHFPGHGDTETDSHIELPVITVTPGRADTIELPPYRAAIAAGVTAVMSAHIAFPALTGDSVPATLKRPILSDLLRDSLAFRGLVVTDALDMGAIVRGWGVTEAPLLALEAGADLLLQIPPDDVVAVIDAIVLAVRAGRLPASRIDRSVRRMLEAKALLGLHRERKVDIMNVPRVVGSPAHAEVAREATERSITLVRDRQVLLPLRAGRVLSVVYRDDVEPLAGRAFHTALSQRLPDLATAVLGSGAGRDEIDAVRRRARAADVVIVAPFVRVGAFRGTLAIAADVADLVQEMARERPVIVVSFGSPYVLAQFPDVGTYLLAWGQWNEPQIAAARALLGEAPVTARLPIPIPPWHAPGEGISTAFSVLDTTARHTVDRTAERPLPVVRPQDAGMDAALGARVDSIVAAALDAGAAPGAAVAIGRHGRLVHLKGYGRIDRPPDAPAVTAATVWDMASLTKVLATTTAVMILVDEGRLDLDAPVVRYLPEFGDDAVKRNVTVRHLLRHDAGLPAFGPLWRSLRGRDAVLRRIAGEPLLYQPGTRTVYSDYGAILLGFIVERVSGMSLDAFFDRRIAAPLGLQETGFTPLRWRAGGVGASVRERIAPTEVDTLFRMTHVRGQVHDENAYALGGVAGHAGLFASARDVAVLAQMLLDGGIYQGTRIVAQPTVLAFTRRQSESSSRALGWDTPSPNSSAGDFFPARSFGHTGFTGTSLWIDPEHDLFLVVLTNRVNPTRENARHVALRVALANAVQRAVRDGDGTRE